MAIKHLLVVGGTGFIGNHLCRVACTRGFKVTSLSLHATKNPLQDVKYLVGDLTNLEGLKKLFANESFEYVVNCGGYIDHQSFFNGGRKLIDVHFEGVQNLIESLPKKNIKRFVNLGSSDEYGALSAPQREDMRESPISPYSLAKLASTQLLQMLWNTERYPAVTLRLFLTYGPEQNDQRFLPQIIAGCLNNKTFPVSEGKQVRDFCYIDDTVNGILQALDTDAANGMVINIASGDPVKICDIISMVHSLIRQGQPEYGKVPYRVGENMALWANTDLAKTILNWSPQISLEQGLKNTIAYYRD